MTPAIFGLAGTELSADERAFFAEADPVGYILFARNCETKDQLRALTDSLRAIHGRDHLIVSIDQEGGRVRRLRPPVWLDHPPGAAYAALYEIAPISAIEAAEVGAELLGRELAEAGISVDFHPPLDLPQPGAHDVIGDRALGTEPMQVAALGRAILDGLGRAGVVGCIKHLPGHGRSTTDTHKEMPTVTASAEELASDLEPFRKLHDAPLGMTGHLLFTAWDPDNPATLSPKVIGDVIRGAIGFDGLPADRRYRHGGAVGHRARTRGAGDRGGLRRGAQLLGHDGRHGRDRGARRIAVGGGAGAARARPCCDGLAR